MASAYTGYKFKKLFVIVISIMFLLALLSVLNPAKEEIKESIIDEASKVDNTGIVNDSYNVYKDATKLDPKSKAEKESGNFFMKLLQENLFGFLFIALLITVILFLVGFKLKTGRGYRNSLQRSAGSW